MNNITSSIDLDIEALDLLEAPVETETWIAAAAGVALGIGIGVLIAT